MSPGSERAMDSIKIIVAGLGSTFVALATQFFLFMLFGKSHGYLAAGIGVVLGLELFISVRRSIIEQAGEQERQNCRANRSES